MEVACATGVSQVRIFKLLWSSVVRKFLNIYRVPPLDKKFVFDLVKNSLCVFFLKYTTLRILFSRFSSSRCVPPQSYSLVVLYCSYEVLSAT